MPKPKISKSEYEKMLKTLEKSGREGLGQYANHFMGLLGAVGGAAAAPAIAGFFGVGAAPTVLGGIAQFFGYSLAAATPVGWIIGAGVAGGVLAYGVGTLIYQGGIHTQRRKILKENILEKIKSFRESSFQQSEDEKFKNVIRVLTIAEHQEKFSRENGMYLIAALNANLITPENALQLCEGLVTGQIKSLKA